MFVKIKKLHPDAQIPAYATVGAACFDLHSIVDKTLEFPMSETFATGLAFAVPDGHTMLIFSRSGHGFKNGVRLANCVGIIDSDYRGEILVKLQTDKIRSFLHVRKGDRVAQAMIIPVEQVQFDVCDDLPETIRGQNGFGSTGG